MGFDILAQLELCSWSAPFIATLHVKAVAFISSFLAPFMYPPLFILRSANSFFIVSLDLVKAKSWLSGFPGQSGLKGFPERIRSGIGLFQPNVKLAFHHFLGRHLRCKGRSFDLRLRRYVCWQFNSVVHRLLLVPVLLLCKRSSSVKLSFINLHIFILAPLNLLFDVKPSVSVC